MNAAEQAKNIEVATKIATIVTSFKHLFPDAKADLSPWANDPDTRELVDPDSIDISFNFPGISRLIKSRCVLVQIRFYEDRLIGIEAAGYSHQGKQWSLSSIDNWDFVGSFPPPLDFESKLKQFYKDIFKLFNH